MKTYLDSVHTHIREPEWPLNLDSLGFCIFRSSSVMWVEVHPSHNMSSLFYYDADTINNICTLGASCQRRWRVFELEDDKVQMIYKQAIKNLYGLWLFPCLRLRYRGKRAFRKCLWIVDCFYVLSISHMCDILHVCLEIHLTFLCVKCAVDTRPRFCTQMLC